MRDGDPLHHDVHHSTPTTVRILCLFAWLAIAASSLTLQAAEPMATRMTSHGGTIVAHWSFSRSEDVDFDGWPEGWKRKQDRDHLAFVPIQIVANNDTLLKIAQAADLKILNQWPSVQASIPGLPALPPSVADLLVGRYFRIELDGGWALVQSPPVAVDSLYRYRLELSAKTESLVFDHAFADLVFLDAQGQIVSQHETKSLTGTTSWTPLNSDLVMVPSGAVALAVRLMVRPIKAAGELDIEGTAGFDDIRIRQLPQMRVTTDQRFAVYDASQRPTIQVRVLGLDNAAASVRFVLKDVDGQRLTEQTVAFEEVASGPLAPGTPGERGQMGDQDSPLTLTLSPEQKVERTTETLTLSTENSGDATRETLTTSPEHSVNETDQRTHKAIEAIASWQMPELKPGFYVVQSMLGDAQHPTLANETTMAILAELPSSASTGPYGWTFPRTVANDLDMKRVPDWLHRLGVGVVKYPCWYAPDDRAQLDTAAWLVGRLQEKDIRTVGMLDQPPESVLAKIDERERREPLAANHFRDAAVWQPLLEPIMTRLTLKVRTWQVGSDRDYSFLGRPQLKQTIKDIGRELQGFGQPIGMAFSWPWLEPLPPASEQSWSAVNLSTSTPLAADELDAYLQSLDTRDGAARDRVETWVTLDPLDATIYDLDTRIADLVLRMTTVRGFRVPATFVTNPLDPKQGLLREDWRPNELLLPWRTTAMLLRDLTRVGSLPMRGGSSTVVLSNANRSTIVAWNPTPTTETIYLGDSIRQVDVWGNAIVPQKVMVDGKPIHQIEVGPVPTFLVDVDPVLVAFRMSTRLVETSLDSLLGRRQAVTLEFINPTRETMSGEVRLKPRADWEVDSRPQPFDIVAGRSAKHTFDVSLRNSAKIGDAQLEFDFLLRTQPPRRFTVARSLHVGPDGLDIEVTTRLSGDELQVLLTITNRTDKPQQYDCLMFPPGGPNGRQYQRRQVIIPGGETVKRLFPWSDGQSLVGQKMLLRAVEQNGDRVLNQVVDVVK